MDGDGGEKKDRLSFRVMYFRDLALLEAYKWKIHLVGHLESRTYRSCIKLGGNSQAVKQTSQKSENV